MHNSDVDTLIPTYQIRFGATQPVRVLCTLLRARATVTGARRAFLFFLPYRSRAFRRDCVWDVHESCHVGFHLGIYYC